MKRLTALFLICAVVLSPLSAQLIDEISEFSRQGVGFDMSNAHSSAAFLDWSKIQMNHSVSMSMGASGWGSESYLTYHNEIYMPLGSRMAFYGNLYWQLQTYASNPALERLNAPAGDIYFDANLVYKISENSSISIGIARYPAMYGYYNSPYYGNRYMAYDPFYFNSFNRGLYP